MISGTFVLFALLLGYGVAVTLWMLATFGITKAAPSFAVKEHHLRARYRVAQECVWLLCTVIGGYLSAWIAGFAGHPWLVCLLLVLLLVTVLWSNAWEVAQRGLGYQLAMSIVTIIGTGAGFLLKLR